MEAGRRARSGRVHRAGSLALCALAAVQAPGCCLVRPPDARVLMEAGLNGWRTPEAAFETFRVAFGADLPDIEFKTLSERFRAEQGLSYLTYRVGRQELIERKPYLAFLARAEVVDSRAMGLEKHRLVVQAAGRRIVVDLVLEDEFLISAGRDSLAADGFLAGGTLDFPRAIRVSQGKQGPTLHIEIRLDEAADGPVDLSQMTGARVERVWRIDGFGDEPAS